MSDARSSHPVRSGCGRPHPCAESVRLQMMALSPLTRDLAPQEHRELDAHVRALAWAEGDPIVLAGEVTGGTYLMVAGRARITRDTESGKEITVEIAAPGDVIGPLDVNPVEAVDSAWAMETTCALYLPADALASIVGRFPALSLALIRLQQERLVQARERDVAHATATVDERVARVLLALDDKLGRERADGSRLLQVRLRRDDIAGMATTTVESASRTVTKLKKAGLIDAGREWVAILDRDGLAAFS